jgi:tRNA(Arg) A34 adenosine deaminase TadA
MANPSARHDAVSRPSLIDRLLDVIEHDILPKTERGVAQGDKLFGAAILRKHDRSLVLAETNHETENPLWHGEVHCLKRFYEMPKTDRPDTRDCIFLSTHEPCSLCLSAITWAGFDNFYYLFSHEDSRDSFAIPHDLNILKEVFGLEPGGYRAENAYWKSFSIRKLAQDLPEPDRSRLPERITAISKRYDQLSAKYQQGKAGNDIPLA